MGETANELPEPNMEDGLLALTEQMASKAVEIANLWGSVAQLQAEIRRLRAEVLTRDGLIAALESQLQEAQIGTHFE